MTLTLDERLDALEEAQSMNNRFMARVIERVEHSYLEVDKQWEAMAANFRDRSKLRLRAQRLEDVIDAQSAALRRLDTELRDARDEMRQGFAAVDQRFEAIDQRFESFDQRFEGVDRRLEGFDRRLDTMDEKLDRILARTV